LKELTRPLSQLRIARVFSPVPASPFLRPVRSIRPTRQPESITRNLFPACLRASTNICSKASVLSDGSRKLRRNQIGSHRSGFRHAIYCGKSRQATRAKLAISGSFRILDFIEIEEPGCREFLEQKHSENPALRPVERTATRMASAPHIPHPAISGSQTGMELSPRSTIRRLIGRNFAILNLL